MRPAEIGDMITLVSLWDSSYHKHGMALLGSLREHHPDFRMFVLALDARVYAALVGKPNVEAVYLPTIEDDELLAAKASRTNIEYIWTLASAFTWWVVDIFNPPSLAYIDADCYLFNSLDTLYAEVSDAPVAITPHRWTPSQADRLRGAGIYNVGWVYFARGNGYRCLREWRDKCLQWCYHRVESDGRFADQGYLNDWPHRWGAHVVQHLGANLAPWNQEQYNYNYLNDRLMITDGVRYDPLLFYHFHGGIDTGYKLNPGVKGLYNEYAGRLG